MQLAFRCFTTSPICNMKYTLQCISNYNWDSTPSFILNFDSARYIFGCGEGNQRICAENGIKTVKLRAVLLPQLNWEFAGGLPGALLTASDKIGAGETKKITLVGPKGLKKLIAGTGGFIYRPNMDFECVEHGQDSLGTVFVDKNVNIRAIITEQKTDILGSGTSRHVGGGASVSYICQGPSIPGKFDRAAAQRLGLRPAIDYKRLIGGESVTLPDGRIVNPADCVGPGNPGSVFIFVSCPSVNLIAETVKDKQLNETIQSASAPKLIIHMCREDVLKNEDYINWISAMPKSILHVAQTNDVGGHVYKSAQQVMLRLSAIDPVIFQQHKATPSTSLKCLNLEFQPVSMHPSLTIQIEPTVKVECTMTGNQPHISEDTDVTFKYDAPTLTQIAVPDCYKNVTVTPLGTASCHPGKHRNGKPRLIIVSSTLVEIGGHNYLLDAGEGTLGQLYRHFGDDQLQDALQKLDMIFISHMHADHHLGIFSILKARHLCVGGKKTTVIGPRRMHKWMLIYAEIEDIGLGSVDFRYSDVLALEGLHDVPGLQMVITVSVDHCDNSFALVATANNGFRFCFSGDCRPSSAFAMKGLDCDLLIHEATLDDSMIENAIKKKHSTTSEAIDVGNQMKAKNLLLTHFSQRYPKGSPLAKRNQNSQMVVGMAHDLMSVRMDSFYKLPSYAALVNELSQDEEVVEEIADNQVNSKRKFNQE